MVKIGRPLKQINKKIFEKLCEIQCRQSEFCAVLECTDKTLEAWCKREYGKNFSEVFKEKRSRGFISLRRAQFQKAVDEKNTAMLIFLGKNWLGQSDKQDVRLSGSKNEPLQINHQYDLSSLSKEELLTLRGILVKAEKHEQTADNS